MVRDGEIEREKRKRPTPQEFYGTVRTPLEGIDDFVPPATAEMLKLMGREMREGGFRKGIYKVTPEGTGVAPRQVTLENPEGSGEIEVELIGAWKGRKRLASAHGLIPGTGGNWYRKPSPTAEPFVKEGQFVRPGQTVGLIGIGKGPDGNPLTQLFPLNPEAFPNGATIVAMPHPNGALIIADKTVVALVEPKT